LGFVLLAAACGGGKSSGNGNGSGTGSICEGPAAPANCNTDCDPTSGTGDATCGAGFHCAASGKCDAQCTPTGGECEAGKVCSNDGFCSEDGGGGDDMPPVDADCPNLQFTVTRVIPSIEILLDRSGSMKKDFPGNDRVDSHGDYITDFTLPPAERFYTEQQALIGPAGIVTQLQDSVYFGASMYPGPMCGNGSIYSTPRALGNAQAIANMIAANRPDGVTPTPAAIKAVVDKFAANPPPANSPPVIVLATDGLPNHCPKGEDGDVAQTETINAAKDAFNHGIKLYLLTVGLEITDQFKQALANAGQGVTSGAVAYSATSPAEMAAAFQAIIGGVVSCDLKLNGMVDANYADTGVVVLNGKTLTYMTDWTLDATGTSIKLSDAKCQELKTTPNPTVNATFACGAGTIFF